MRLFFFASLAALLMSSLGSCTQDSLTQDPSGSSIHIEVRDAGYVCGNFKANRGLGSRDNDDYTTDFTPGDQIGVYAVKNQKIFNGIQNFKLTAVAKGSDIVWQSDTPLALTAGVSYYAYYPYREGDHQVDLTVDPRQKDAASVFFKQTIANWKVATDQSTQALYSASDLMVSQGKQYNHTLSFGMAHQMALAVMDFHNTKAHYEFGSAASAVYNYKVSAPPMPVFKGFTPWHYTDYIFRYLVNPEPSQKPASLTGGYLGGIAYWECSLSKLKPEQFFTYEIGDPRAAPVEVSYNLQAGDFLLKDGILLPKGIELDSVYKAAVRAVVMQAFRDASDDPTKVKYKSKDGKTTDMTIHGYVVGLFDAQPKGDICRWSPNDTINIGTIAYGFDFMGYYNTQVVKTYDAGHGNNLKTNFPAFYWANVDYESKYPAPNNSSGWFLPSEGQLVCAYGIANDPDHHEMRDLLDQSFTAAGGEPWGTLWYWSSSETESNPSANGMEIRFRDGLMSDCHKAFANASVRALVAF